MWFHTDFDPNRLHQGTIFFASGFDGLENGYYAVLNPECDLEHSKANYVNIVAAGDTKRAFLDITSDIALSTEQINGLEELKPKVVKNLLKILLKQINGSTGLRWYFTPVDNFVDLPLLVFDLQNIRSFSSDRIESILPQRRAVIRSPYKEQLVTRLYSYLTRVGSPDQDKESLAFDIMDSVGLKFPPNEDSRLVLS